MRTPIVISLNRSRIAQKACVTGLGLVTLFTAATLSTTPALADDVDPKSLSPQALESAAPQIEEAAVPDSDATQSDTSVSQQTDGANTEPATGEGAELGEQETGDGTGNTEPTSGQVSQPTEPTDVEMAKPDEPTTGEGTLPAEQAEGGKPTDVEQGQDTSANGESKTTGNELPDLVSDEKTDIVSDSIDQSASEAGDAKGDVSSPSPAKPTSDPKDASPTVSGALPAETATTTISMSVTPATTQNAPLPKLAVQTDDDSGSSSEQDEQTPKLIKVVKNGETIYYWQDADGNKAKNGLVKITHNTEGKKLAADKQFWAYAKSNGRLVTGSWTNGDIVYLATKTAHLLKKNGWLTLSKKRYYMMDYAAQTGIFSAGNYLYYGTPKKGHIIYGVEKTSSGWLAANKKTGRLAQSKFVTTDAITGKKKIYWFGSDAKLVKGRLVTPKQDDAPYAAYARKNGAIVTGHWTNDDGNVYVADKTGKLAKKSGWLVSSKYDDSLERYRMVNYAAQTGYFQVGKSWYYGIPDKGYVARGTTKTPDKSWVKANIKTGKLATSRWVVTDKFTGDVERFWFGKNGEMARDRLITKKEGAGYYAYAKPNGAVVRGVYNAGDGVGYVANMETGKLMSGKTGWIVTGKYNNGTLRRYRYDSKTHSVKIGGFKVGKRLFYAFPNKGYVATGKVMIKEGCLLADSAGRLEQTTGWIVTKKYDGEKQRYYLHKDEKLGIPIAQVGLFSVKSGKKTHKYYGDLEYGFVKRNCRVYSGTKVYKANNLGRLKSKGRMNAQQRAAYKVAQTKKSKTNWLITMERTSHILYLWHKKGKGWELEWDQLCSIGRRYGSLYSITPISESVVWEKRPWFSSTVWALGFNSRYHIHSVIVNRYVQVTDGRLGMNISSGCIRLPVVRAHDLYLKVPVGSHVSIYDVNGNFH